MRQTALAALASMLASFSAFAQKMIADQVATHAETVALLSDDKQNGRNSGLISWTKDAVPIDQDHQADINAM